MTCEQRRDLLLLYVTDALDVPESIEMRQHLQSGCAECAGYLAEAEAVMSSLPLALDLSAPSPHLKEKLMQRIAGAEAPMVPAATEPEEDEDDKDDRGYPSPFNIFRYLIPTAIAAGIAIFVTHSLMMKKVDALQQQTDVALAQVQELQHLRTQFQSQSQVVAMLETPGLKLIPLKPTDKQPNAVANLLWDQKHNEWAIVTTGMTPAASGQCYELWFVTEAGAKVAAGTFDVDSKGSAAMMVPIPPGLSNLSLAAVTNEKAGGAAQPLGDFQMTGNVQ